MADFIDRTGEIHITKEGYPTKIIECFSCRNCTIQFEDGTIIKNRQYGDVVRGQVKNPYHKSVYGIGYFGIGKYSGKTHLKTYKTWRSMLERCYDEKCQEKHPSYKGCSVDERWYNFQVFAEWFEKNYKSDFMGGWNLDKDVLLKGNKIYSPKTCAFVPIQINNLFVKSNSKRGDYPIGVRKVRNRYVALRATNEKTRYLGTFDTIEEAFKCYKLHKENHIKEVAQEWKSLITEACYQALINYNVEITD